MLSKKLDDFMFSLKNEQYFEAHEDLEEIWFEKRFEDSNEIKLLKGFINAAVSFELYKRGKLDASKKVWKNYLKYRTLLYKTESKYINKLHHTARYIENIKLN